MDSGYYLSDLLSSGIIRDHRIVGKRYDYERIRVRGISVQEAPFDLSLVEAGEIILSTFSGLQKDTALMERFICIVAKARAAALLLTFLDPAFEIPKAVIDCAAKKGLPLFQIPWELRFKDITEKVNRQIFDRRISRYTGLQEKLYSSYFDMKPLQHAIQIISDSLDRHVIVINAMGQTVAADRIAAKRSISGVEYSDEESCRDDRGNLYFSFPIFLGSARAGTLLLSEEAVRYAEDEETAEKPDRAFILQYVCFPVALWFNRKAIEDLTCRRLKNDFVKDLANKKYDSFEAMLQQGNRLGFNLSLPYACMVIRAVHADRSRAGQYTYETTETENAIMQILEDVAEHRIMYAASGNHLEFIVYHEVSGRQSSQEIDRYLIRVGEEIGKCYPEYRLYSGISEISLKTMDFDRLFTNASLALHYCLNDKTADKADAGERNGGRNAGSTSWRTASRYYYTYLDAKEAQIVSILSRNAELTRTAEKVVGALASYGKTRDARNGNPGEGKENNVDLVGTLTTYIRCNHSISRTARALNIHRQSLLYRMEKIEEVTEMKLGNHQDLFLLEIYCRVMSVF